MIIDVNLLLRNRKYLMSFEMILLCLMVVISSIQGSIIDVPATADSLRGRTIYTLYTDKRTWKEARQVCRQKGGYLINIETEERYQRYLSLKTSQTFRTSIDTPWIGLHWRSENLHWDGSECPPPRVHLTESYPWWNNRQSKYSSIQMCYIEKNNSFQRLSCVRKNTFICETYKDGTCRYEDSPFMSFTHASLNVTATTLDECKSSCDNTSGCFLTGNLDQVDVCLMLLATDVSNTTIAIKKCYDTVKVTDAQSVTRDVSNPTDCPTTTLSSETVMGIVSATSNKFSDVSSTITCPTVTSIITDTLTETRTVTVDVTGSQCNTTEFLTDVSTFIETATETITAGPPLVSIVTQTVGTIITTVLQTSTVTINDSSLVVPTVTETQTRACDTVTIDVTGSCSSTVLYSPGMAPTIEATVQSSFGSLQVNGITASIPTGIKGSMGSDGIMRSEVCREVIVVTPDPVAEQAAVESIVNELTVDKKNVTAVVQKKVSTQDKRSSSVAIGYMGIAFLVLPFLLIIAVDLPTLIRGGSDVIKLCKDEDIF